MPNEPRKRRVRTVLVQLAAGLAAGFAFGALLARSGVFAELRALPLGADDALALAIAAVLFLSGLFTLAAASSPAAWARMYEKRALEPGDDVDAGALANGRQQAVVVLLAAVALATPPLAAASSAEPQLRIAAAAGVFLLLAIQTWFNWRLWRDGDELTRAVIVTTGALCFWLLQFVLFGYAVLARLALVPDIGSWTMTAILMLVYLGAGIAISIRRGLVNG